MNQPLNHVFVAATMSAGKSSIINALLGQELLHSANEATTAKVTRIYHLKQAQSVSASYCAKGLIVDTCEEVCPEQLKVWNQAEQIAHIDITVPVPAHQQKKIPNGYVIYDSPGPNNSQNEQHGLMFLDALKQQEKSIILYVLNATQLGTFDCERVLTTIKLELPQTKIIFALNKVDNFDEERGEIIENAVNRVRQYLENLGFQNPIIVPTMARIALIAKKHLCNESLSLHEKMELSMELKRFRENPNRLNNASHTPVSLKDDIHRQLNITKPTNSQTLTSADHELEKLIAYSGISTIGQLITDTI